MPPAFDYRKGFEMLFKPKKRHGITSESGAGWKPPKRDATAVTGSLQVFDRPQKVSQKLQRQYESAQRGGNVVKRG